MIKNIQSAEAVVKAHNYTAFEVAAVEADEHFDYIEEFELPEIIEVFARLVTK